MKDEIWKPITEFPSYQVSNYSRVKNKYDYILTPRANQKEYLRVLITINKTLYWRSIYRLSAIEFIPNPENKPQVNHKDGDKNNNHISNLEWNTNKENQIHRFQVIKVAHGSKGYKQRKDNPKPREEWGTRAKKIDQLDKDTNQFIKTWDSLTEAHNFIGCRGIWNSLKNPEKIIGGYKWRIHIKI